uniref:AlNc14C106G6223 protein n=1 Tax=Albugo laibachii Nc14 TaxID=890382 RepID=F0WI16_9STRA|nr:AlNc14C106G6223 [Albugo laibachii Nc14]|eukprot:CCA20893.1 AlNc14C106G6223 [Albugo laibachii Nc14]
MFSKLYRQVWISLYHGLQPSDREMMDGILNSFRDDKPIDSMTRDGTIHKTTEIEIDKLESKAPSTMQEETVSCHNADQCYQKEVAKLIQNIRHEHSQKHGILIKHETEKSMDDQLKLTDISMCDNDFEDLKRRVRMQEASRRYRKRKKASTRSQREELERLKTELCELQRHTERMEGPEDWKRLRNTEKRMQEEHKNTTKIRKLIRALRVAQRKEKNIIQSIGTLI